MRWPVIALLVMALPLVGIHLSGREIAPYLEVPPQTRYVVHAGFSWAWFLFFALLNLLMALFLLGAVGCGRRRLNQGIQTPGNGGSASNPAATGRVPRRFPWWGWLGLIVCLTCWLLAWQRFAWFDRFQPHTFVPIWVGFILLLNALTVWRSGSCPMLRRPRGFVLLFPASAVFWWFFEYLNRFVQNWYYTGIDHLGPGAYSFLSSLAFSTVLPGVLSMMALLLTFPALGSGLARCRPISLPSGPGIPLATLAAAAIGLCLIGVFPDQLFALLWVSPLLIVLCVQRLSGRPTVLAPLQRGDWRPLVLPALAALICGFFWELWNYSSLARWSYAIPYVQRFHLFEMPILGYGGYLPFGLQCLVAATPAIGDPFGSAGKQREPRRW